MSVFQETPQDVLTLHQLYAILRNYRLTDSLFFIGLVNSALKIERGRGLYRDNIPDDIIVWINRWYPWEPLKDIDYKKRTALFLGLSRLARFLLLSKANDYGRLSLWDNDSTPLYLLDCVGALFDEKIEGAINAKSDLLHIFGRMSQWQFPLQGSQRDLIGLGYLLFIEIPARLSVPYDIDKKMREYFGIGVLEFIASGFALWLMTNGVLKHKLDIQIPKLAQLATPSNIQTFIQLSSGTRRDYRRMIREGTKVKKGIRDIYQLEPFLKMPIIRAGYAKKLEAGTFLVPQPFYLLNRASLGPFYLLADKERLLNPKGNSFRTAFGHIYREYVGLQLRLAMHPAVFIDLDDPNEANLLPNIKKPDYVIIEGDVCVLFEVKTSILTLDSRTFFNINSASEEIKGPNGKIWGAVLQLDSVAEHILKGALKDRRFERVTKVVKIVVGFEDIYLANAYILPFIEQAMPCNNLQIATISDIEIIGSLLAKGENIGSKIVAKLQNDGDKEIGIEAYLRRVAPPRTTSYSNPVLVKAFEDFGNVAKS